ncbi:MAG: hypothetical protein AB1469_04560 [Pseudomonadota bacterium]
MLHYLRQRNRSLGRGVVMLLVTAWLALALQPCVMAAVAVPQNGVGCEHMAQPGTAPVSCVNQYHHDGAQPSGVALPSPSLTLFPVAAWEPRQTIPSAARYCAAQLSSRSDPPPLVRFCVLQV